MRASASAWRIAIDAAVCGGRIPFDRDCWVFRRREAELSVPVLRSDKPAFARIRMYREDQPISGRIVDHRKQSSGRSAGMQSIHKQNILGTECSDRVDDRLSAFRPFSSFFRLRGFTGLVEKLARSRANPVGVLFLAFPIEGMKGLPFCRRTPRRHATSLGAELRSARRHPPPRNMAAWLRWAGAVCCGRARPLEVTHG
jgi:hypothetical protein